MRIITTLITLMLLLVTLAGCGSRQLTQESFMREGVSLASIETIAMLPLENLGGGAGPAERVREITMTQVLASGLFDVLDKGRVDSTLRAEALAPDAPIETATLRRLGQRLGVQAFLLGSVEQSMESRGAAAYPEISLTLRLVDSESGLVLWQASGRGSGYSLRDRLFGLAPRNSFQVTLELVNRMLRTMR
jgi:TolB-like protein